MNSNSVFIDVQGFKDRENKFILKEFAFATRDKTQVYIVNPPYPYNLLSRDEKRQVSWIERNRGVYWNDGHIDRQQLYKIISPYLQNKIIYVKGFEKISWIKEFCTNCTFHELGEKGYPNFDELYKTYCNKSNDFHCLEHKNVCALRNVICLRKWYIENNYFLYF